MNPLAASVGSGAANRLEDVRLVQSLLNLDGKGSPLAVDGRAGPKTVARIKEFQKSRLQMLHPDGRIDSGGRTMRALLALLPPSIPMVLPAFRGRNGIKTSVYWQAADDLQCAVETIMAVSDVESAGGGFLVDGRPKILFEAHVFSRLTQHQHDVAFPQISSRSWNRALYKGGENEYPRLESAMLLNGEAAVKATSWGRFQIMGFNYAACGYADIQTFVSSMYRSEEHHLHAFVAFLKSQGLASALRALDWKGFASGYNGKSYASNRYDSKLQASYDAFVDQKMQRPSAYEGVNMLRGGICRQ